MTSIAEPRPAIRRLAGARPDLPDPPAPQSRLRRGPRAGARDRAHPRSPHLSAVRDRGRTACASRSRRCPASRASRSTSPWPRRARRRALGVPAVALFPALPETRKDKLATESTNPDGLLQRAVRELKDAAPEILVITDVAMDPYSSDGHDGAGRGRRDPQRPDARRSWRAMAVAQAEAGADMVAPSDMMDGRVGAIREALDENGFQRRRDPRLLREVRVGVLRPVPRGARLGAAQRRQEDLPDGSRQRARGAARGRARRARRRRHGDGEAGAPLPRRDPPGEGPLRRCRSRPTR